jgi:hypothetical protein
VSDLTDLRRLEPQFFRAPSAHNTQPWLLDYSPDRVELGFDPARALPVGDPTRRDLHLSLGAFVEAALISASAAGTAVRFEPSFEGTRVGAFVPASEPYATPYSPDDLERRQTSRLPYEPGRLTADDLAAVRAQLGQGAELHELPTRDLVELAAAADRHLYDSPAVVEELRSWLRLSRRDPRYEQDGLSYDCLDLSRVEAAAVALLLRPTLLALARRLRLYRTFTAATTNLLEREGSALVLTGAGETPEAALAHGQTLLRVWLALARRGLYTHPLSQILDCPETARELAGRVGAQPVSVFRAGRSAVPPRSARLLDFAQDMY